MAINRRHFLKYIAAAGVANFVGTAHAVTGGYVVSAKITDQYFACLLNANGKLKTAIPLPDRGHGFASCPVSNKVVVFARRPRNFAIVFDVSDGMVLQEIQLRNDRHLFGHGCFSSDGNFLFTTENNYDEEKGVIGIYDAFDNFKRIGEVDSYGIGPHEILRSNKGTQLIVANGGILTHPDFPRQKLNLPTMQSSLVYLDIQTGALLEKVSLPADFQKLSIRHIVQTSDDTIWYGGQYEGRKEDDISLVGYHQSGQKIDPLSLALPIQQTMGQYIGSVAISLNDTIAISCPRSNKLLLLDSKRKQLVQNIDLPDVCALANSNAKITAFCASGQLWLDDRLQAKADGIEWDNHALSLSI